MIPFANDTVTLVKRNETEVDGKTRTTYSTHIIKGCAWRRVAVHTLNGLQTEKGVQTSCRMPVGIMPAVGDALLLGAHNVVVENYSALAALVQSNRQNGAFIVTSAKDNARPGMPIPHYVARGE